MNKNELLKELSEKEFIDSISTDLTLVETKPDGTKLYIINVREVIGKCAIYRNIAIYVIDEGKTSERAYYKEYEPSAQIIIKEKVLSEDNALG